MYHYAIRTRCGPAFRTWEDGLALWLRIATACRGARAACLMFTHFHALSEVDLRLPLGRALSGHTRMLRARGEDFAGWRRVEHDGEIVSEKKLRRSLRYIALNPCRAGFVSGPLAWPFSLYRDTLGFVRVPFRERIRNPTGFHAYVSSDPTTRVEGTPFPDFQVGDVDMHAVEAAVSEFLRVTLGALRQQGQARRYLIGMAKALGVPWPDIRRHLGVTKQAVGSAPLPSQFEVDRIRYLLLDPRFPGLSAGRIRRPLYP